MKMKKSLSIVLLVVMLSGVFGAMPTFAKEITIKDIQSTDEAYQIIQWVVNQGYMTLVLRKFFPTKFVKRGEFAAIVTKLSGSGTVLQNPKTPTFKDVSSKNQFYKQIETAKNYMAYYKNKTEKLFKPNSYITREDAVMSIVKVLGYDLDEALGSIDASDVSLDDVIEDAGSINSSLVKYVAIGVINELMDLRTSEDKSYFDPKKNITRKDLAILIYNAYQKKDYTMEEIDNDNSSNKTTLKDNSSKTTPNNSNDKTVVNDTNKMTPDEAGTSSDTEAATDSKVKPKIE